MSSSAKVQMLSRREDVTVVTAIALYDPNGPAAIIAFIAFGAIAVTYWIRYFKFGKPRPKFMLPMIFGTTLTSLGYICRFSRRNGISAWSWLFETMFILLSPCLFLAQVYVLLPRIARYMENLHDLAVGPKVIKGVFITADVTTVITQLAGTALMITFGDLVRIGKILVTAGLWVQLACFLTFVLICSLYGRRSWASLSKESYASRRFRSIKALYCSLLLACLLMFIRSVYRVAEYTAGGQSALAHNEVVFYILDTIPMLFFSLTFVVVWAPKILDEAKGSDVMEMGYR